MLNMNCLAASTKLKKRHLVQHIVPKAKNIKVTKFICIHSQYVTGFFVGFHMLKHFHEMISNMVRCTYAVTKRIESKRS
jgi:hypothetical protein